MMKNFFKLLPILWVALAPAWGQAGNNVGPLHLVKRIAVERGVWSITVSSVDQTFLLGASDWAESREVFLSVKVDAGRKEATVSSATLDGGIANQERQSQTSAELARIGNMAVFCMARSKSAPTSNSTVLRFEDEYGNVLPADTRLGCCPPEFVINGCPSSISPGVFGLYAVKDGVRREITASPAFRVVDWFTCDEKHNAVFGKVGAGYLVYRLTTGERWTFYGGSFRPPAESEYHYIPGRALLVQEQHVFLDEKLMRYGGYHVYLVDYSKNILGELVASDGSEAMTAMAATEGAVAIAVSGKGFNRVDVYAIEGGERFD